MPCTDRECNTGQLLIRRLDEAIETVLILGANRVRSGRNRWLHGDMSHDLHQVILQHVSKCARLIVVTTTIADAKRFGRSNLNVVNIIPIPKRLEYRVRKSSHQQILHRLFPEIVIDSIDVVFVKMSLPRKVKLTCRLNVVTEWLFNHQSSERTFAPVQSMRRQKSWNLVVKKRRC